MKNYTPLVRLVMSVCMAGVLLSLWPANVVAQSNAQPFCKFTFVDHHGRSVKLSTGTTHATSKSLTFIFDTGQRLIINFTIIRAGHFVAESARSKDPQILFYPSPGSPPVPMVGAVVISSVKPVTGNFTHLISDGEEHLTLLSGTFSI